VASPGKVRANSLIIPAREVAQDARVLNSSSPCDLVGILVGTCAGVPKAGSRYALMQIYIWDLSSLSLQHEP
jgi:hypothetical protein